MHHLVGRVQQQDPSPPLAERSAHQWRPLRDLPNCQPASRGRHSVQRLVRCALPRCFSANMEDDAVSPSRNVVQILEPRRPVPPRLNLAKKRSSVLRDGLQVGKPIGDYSTSGDLCACWLLAPGPVQRPAKNRLLSLFPLSFLSIDRTTPQPKPCPWIGTPQNCPAFIPAVDFGMNGYVFTANLVWAYDIR